MPTRRRKPGTALATTVTAADSRRVGACRLEYGERFIEIYTQVYRFRDAYAQGCEEGHREMTEIIARRLIAMGYSVADIVYATRLSAAEVRKLAKTTRAPRRRRRPTASSASP
jgi:hypothetical protein